MKREKEEAEQCVEYAIIYVTNNQKREDKECNIYIYPCWFIRHRFLWKNAHTQVYAQNH